MDIGRVKTNSLLTLAELAAVTALVSCSLVRWRGTPDAVQGGDWASTDVKASTAPARARVGLPPAPSSVSDDVEYYADLGPAEIDVSQYPTQQKYDYELFKNTCGGCHTLARAVNSPTESRTYWRFHLLRMRLHMRLSGRVPVDPTETRRLLDFLQYDAQVRKIEHRADFDRQAEGLRRRYDVILEKRLRALQTEPQPQLIQER